jgi:SAM-dependent methyltransferase
MPKTTRVKSSQQVYTVRDTCRLCESRELTKVWSFGETPLANAYLAPAAIGSSEPMVPLEVYYCGDCHLVQLRHVVDPEVLFSRYLYVSSTSASFRAHFAEYAADLVQRFQLKKKDLVVDIGSNDGILLRPLQAAGMRILGIDPAENIAAEATSAGIQTLARFFTPEVAREVKATYGPVTIITANNVFAHTDRIDVFVEAVKELLADDGVYAFEVQYLGDLVANNLFDIVYHEHVCYYHLTPLAAFFARQGLEVFDVTRVPVHGGSLRVFVQRQGGPHNVSSAVGTLLRQESANGLNELSTYQAFADRINHNRLALRTLLGTIKQQGKRVVGYGAPAKATTLLYAFGLGRETLEYVVDDDKRMKQGLVMPGSHIPIVAPDRLYADKPEYCLILAWNFAEPIMKTHSRFTAQGGRFIIPVPEPRVI